MNRDNRDRRQFDSAEGGRDEADRKRMGWLDDLRRDVRVALRSLARRPGHASMMIMSLAAGVAVTSVVFAIADGFALRPLPFPSPDELVAIARSFGGGQRGIALRDVERLRAESRAFTGIAIYDNTQATIEFADGADRIEGTEASANLLSVLGARPAVGRDFDSDDDRHGASRVVILSQRLAVRLSVREQIKPGSIVILSGTAHTVVGVMAAGFAFPRWSDFWIPIGHDSTLADPSNFDLSAVARRAAGVPLVTAARDVSRLLAPRSTSTSTPVADRGNPVIEPLDDVIRDVTAGRSTIILLGAVGCLLALATTNVALLLLLRATERREEFSIRVSMGAGRLRLARQLCAEGLTVATIGVAFGLVGGWATLRAVAHWLPARLPYVVDIAIDWRVALVATTVLLLATTAFSLAPIVWGTGYGVSRGLRGRGVGPSGTGGQNALIVVEIALAFSLVLFASTALNDYGRLINTSVGFDADGVLIVQYRLPETVFSDRDVRRAFAREATVALGRLPSVQSVGGILRSPAGGEPLPQVAVTPVRREFVFFNAVTPGLFAALKIPLIAGRDFSALDRADGELVVIVSKRLAEQLWPAQSAIGQFLELRDTPASTQPTAPRRVVGVVGDVRHAGMGSDATPGAYVPYDQFPAWYLSLAIRLTGDAAPVAAALRPALRRVHPSVIASGVRPLSDMLAETIWRPALIAKIFSAFAMLSLALAGIGLYGMLSGAVNARRHELGIRVAVGGTAVDLVSRVLRTAATLAGLGIAVGVPCALLGWRLARAQVSGLGSPSLELIATTVAVLSSTVLIAAVQPALRAASVSPLEVLRGSK